MSDDIDEFIQLHRTFHDLALSEEEGKEAVALKPGDSLHVRPGMIHAHRNLSATDRLVFLEFVIVDKGQRSTVPMR